ncbi:MAG: isoaspartyl peptidase/L-asparaginase [Pseudomonadota bacterium]
MSYSLVIHGGAGGFESGQFSPAEEKAYRSALNTALKAGEAVLANDGSAMDAITTAITLLEDSPLFNAGHGAVFNAAGEAELDASIMDGRDLNAGAVAGVKRTKSPIALARRVMEKSQHVMLHGRGADIYAEQQQLEMVENSYFHTEHRREQLKRAQERGAAVSLSKFGTVGAAARDRDGNLAAGTSTGGLTNKRYGRVGDSPIIGAGTYANNKSCAVSATGHGEFFIRATVARDICARMEFTGASLGDAARQVVMEQLVEMKGDGGIIAVDYRGNYTLTFNTNGMFRGSVQEGNVGTVGILRGDDAIFDEASETGR